MVLAITIENVEAEMFITTGSSVLDIIRATAEYCKGLPDVAAAITPDTVFVVEETNLNRKERVRYSDVLAAEAKSERVATMANGYTVSLSGGAHCLPAGASCPGSSMIFGSQCYDGPAYLLTTPIRDLRYVKRTDEGE